MSDEFDIINDAIDITETFYEGDYPKAIAKTVVKAPKRIGLGKGALMAAGGLVAAKVIKDAVEEHPEIQEKLKPITEPITKAIAEERERERREEEKHFAELKKKQAKQKKTRKKFWKGNKDVIFLIGGVFILWIIIGILIFTGVLG